MKTKVRNVAIAVIAFAKARPILTFLVVGLLGWGAAIGINTWINARQRERYERERAVIQQQIDRLHGEAEKAKGKSDAYAEQTERLSGEIEELRGRVGIAHRDYKSARDAARAAGGLPPKGDKFDPPADPPRDFVPGSDDRLCERAARVGVPCRRSDGGLPPPTSKH